MPRSSPDCAPAPCPCWLTSGSPVARPLPELLAERPDLPVPGPVAEAWQRQRPFEALARAFAIRSQLPLLLLDDLQWCDRGTLEWLYYLSRYDPHARLLVVAALHSEEVAPDHLLPILLETLRCGGQLIEIEIRPLNESETLSLAEGVTGRKLNPALAAPLHQGSEGNPPFVVGMNRAGLSTGRP